MKFNKIIAALLLVVLVLACLPVSAQQERVLTLKRAVQVNDTQIVLEFSEPIAINLHQHNRGPFCPIRLISSSGGTTRFNSEKHLQHPNYNTILQWNGSLRFLDNKHDRLIWTLTGSTLGVESVSDITEYAGDLAEYKDRRAAFVIEEVPFNEKSVTADMRIDNITTADGEVYLRPTYPSGWERVVVAIEQDFSYKVDPALFESTENEIKFEGGLIDKGEYVEPEPEAGPAVTVVEVMQNDPIIIGAILGGCALFGALMIVIAVIVRKKRKAA